MRIHLCNDYIELLEARLKLVKLIHKYLCEHDEELREAFDDVELFDARSLVKLFKTYAVTIGADAAEELVEASDEVTKLVDEIAKVRRRRS